LGGSVRGMVRSLVFHRVLMMAIVVGVVLAVGGSVGAAESVTVEGEYIDYVRNEEHHLIGPFADMRSVFHPGGVGPVGVPCTADTVDVVQNEVVFTFDPANGSVTGTGLLELSCEFHPGCGAVTRIMEASYRGDYDAVSQLMTGTVDFWSAGGESTNWGTESALNPVDQCLDRFITEGWSATTNWVLNVGETTPTGYQTAVIEGDDPAQRYAFFTLPALVTPVQGAASALAGGGGEAAVESIADSGDAQSSTSGETVGSLGGSAGMRVLLFLLAAAIGGALVYMIRYVIRLRMGFKQ
jgi:hypothetical protein